MKKQDFIQAFTTVAGSTLLRGIDNIMTRTTVIAAILAVIMTGNAFSKSVSIPPNSTISVTAMVCISAETNKINDEFTAKVNTDVIAEDGTIIIPLGTDVIGKIVSLQKTAISVILTRIKIGDRYIPIETEAIQLVEKQQDGKKNVGKGVAVGVMVGSIFMPPGYGRKMRGALLGGVIGGAAAASKEKEQAENQFLHIPQGTPFQFKLSRALVIEQ